MSMSTPLVALLMSMHSATLGTTLLILMSTPSNLQSGLASTRALRLRLEHPMGRALGALFGRAGGRMLGSAQFEVHALAVGSRVRLEGLQARAELNGAHGRFLYFHPPSGRCAVRLAEQHRSQLIRAKPANVKPLPPLAQWDEHEEEAGMQLMRLAPELLCTILAYLSPLDLLRAAATCVQMHQVKQSYAEKLWGNLLSHPRLSPYSCTVGLHPFLTCLLYTSPSPRD